MNSDDLANFFELQLAEYQQMLDSGETKRQPATAGSTLPESVRERLERNKRCLDLLATLKPKKVAPEDAVSSHQGHSRSAGVASKTIGRFQILEELGSGGFGIVYRAWDPRVDREVALKIPRFESLASRESQLRFEQEARAVAKLDHPQIVSVLEAGVVGLLPYIATIYYPSVTLAAWLQDHPESVAPRSAAELVQKLAEGLAHAHDHGVLHRDIKPSNLLLVPHSGRVTSESTLSQNSPKIIDFGLAKLADANRDMTQTGTLLGTIRYMPPEVAAGRMHEVGPASDVYSLGAVLYELLTGQPPFAASSDLEVLRGIEAHEPTAIRYVRPDVPRDLEIICLKCLEKEPAQRYPTARSLAEDLARYLSGLPIHARRATPWQRLAKWGRRNPALAALVSVIAASAGALMVVLMVSNASISRALQDANQERARASKNEQLAREREEVAREYAYSSDVRLAQEAWDRATPSEAEQLLKRHIPAQGQRDTRGMEWHYLWNSMHQYSHVVATQPTAVWSLAYEPRHNLFATGDRAGKVRLWSLEPPSLLREMEGHGPGDINALRFTPDGETLITAGEDEIIRQWCVADGQMIKTLQGHSAWVGALALSNSGDLLSGDGDGRVLLWDRENGEVSQELYRHRGAVRWILVHPRHDWVVSGCDEGEVRIWDFRENKAPGEVPTGLLEMENREWSRRAAFDEKGNWLFAHGHLKLLRWEFRPGQNIGTLVDRITTPQAYSLNIVDHNEWLLEGGPDGNPDITVRRLKAVEKIERELHGHSDCIRDLAGINEANAFLSSSEDGTVRKWQLQVSDPTAQRFYVGDHVDVVAWSPDNTTVVAGVHSGELLAFFDPLHAGPKSLGHHDARILGLATDMTGRRVIAAYDDKTVKWWSLDSEGQPDAFQTELVAELMALTASDHLLAYANNKSLFVVDANSGESIWQFDHPMGISAIAALDDLLFTTSSDGVVRMFDATLGTLLKESPPQRGSVRSLSFSSDRKRFVTVCVDKTVRIFDARTLEEQSVFSHSAKMHRAFFIDDDRRLLIYDDDHAWIVNPANGQSMLKLPHVCQDGAARPNLSGQMLVAPHDGDLWAFKLNFH